jgi:hypothetical protein
MKGEVYLRVLLMLVLLCRCQIVAIAILHASLCYGVVINTGRCNPLALWQLQGLAESTYSGCFVAFATVWRL